MCIAAALVLTSTNASVLSEYPGNKKSLFDDANIDANDQGQRRLGRWYYKQSYTINIDFNVTNLSFQQPFGRFFVMVHNHKVDPLFTLGMPSSEGLQDLAENGSPAMLVDMYKDDPNVLFVETMGEGPLAAGGKTTFTVPVSLKYQYISMASMAVNTNDW